MEIWIDWSDLKSKVDSADLDMRYIEVGNQYHIWAIDSGCSYRLVMDKVSPTPNPSDQKDFEDNYKSDCNKPSEPRDEDNKVFTRAESRPLGTATYFTMAGDKTSSPQEIGGGKIMRWDFSNSDDEITAPSGFKRKRVDIQFIDNMYLKEGTVYFKDKQFGSYIDVSVVCPAGGYYRKNNGSIAQASEDTMVNHYVNKHHMMDTCVMGDELNTEAASQQIPSYMKYRVEVTVPDTDSSSKGYIELEMYRERSVILT